MIAIGKIRGLCRLAGALLAGVTVHAAETSYSIPTSDPKITIRLSTPLTIAPRFGFFPLRVWIDNQSDQDGRWELNFQAGARDRFPGAVDSSVSIQVDAHQNKETWFYIPLAAPGVSVAPAVTSTSLSSTAMAALASSFAPAPPAPMPGAAVTFSPGSTLVRITSSGGIQTIEAIAPSPPPGSGLPQPPPVRVTIPAGTDPATRASLIAAAQSAAAGAAGSAATPFAPPPPGPGAAPARPPGPAPIPASAVESAARRALTATDLLRVPATVRQTMTTVPIGDGSGYYSYAMILFEQTGPVASLPRPDPASVPAGIVVNLHASSVPGMVTRTITYMDAAELDKLNNATQAITRERALADLMRHGFLRDQPSIAIGPMTVSNQLERAGTAAMVISTYAVAETGPRQLLPMPPAASIPAGVSVQILPAPGSATDAMRYFFLGGAAPVGVPRAPAATPAPGPASPMALLSGAISTAPPPAMIGGMDPTNITGEISGFGLRATQSVSLTGPLVNTPLPTPPVAVIPRMEGQLRNRVVTATRGLPTISAIDPFVVPADWRVWSSFHALVMRSDDLAALDAARAASIRQWVAMGGLLVLTPSREDARREVVANLGAGTILTLGTSLGDADPTNLVMKMKLNQLSLGLPPRDSLRFFSSSDLAGLVHSGDVDSRLLAVFVGVFGLIIGPVNLFIFARRNRHRLFVTTPVLALIGAAGMMAIIVKQDGFGGDGVRSTVVSFVPGEPVAAIYQDQVARTGFLTRRDFPLNDTTVMVGIPIPEYDSSGRDSNLLRDRGAADGDWFRNRWRQGHHLRSLIPTRARIEIVGVTAEGAPIVESTLTTELKNFIYVAMDDTIWRSDSIAPGRRIPLEKTDMQLRPLISAGATRNLDALLNASAQRESGRWFARGGATEFAPIGTLPSVRWKDSSIYYTGVALPPSAQKTPGGSG